MAWFVSTGFYWMLLQHLQVWTHVLDDVFEIPVWPTSVIRFNHLLGLSILQEAKVNAMQHYIAVYAYTHRIHVWYIYLYWQREEILPLFKSNGGSCKKLVPDLPEECTLKNTKTKALDCFHLYRFRCMMTCVWCRWTMDGANYINQFDFIASASDAEYNSLVTTCQRPNKQSITYPLIWSIKQRSQGSCWMLEVGSHSFLWDVQHWSVKWLKLWQLAVVNQDRCFFFWGGGGGCFWTDTSRALRISLRWICQYSDLIQIV